MKDRISGVGNLLGTAHRIHNYQPIPRCHTVHIHHPHARPRVWADARAVEAVKYGGEGGRVAGVVAELADAALPEGRAVIGDCGEAGGRGG